MTETLHSIIKATKQSPQAYSVTVGHSFGGLLLEHALSQSLLGVILNRKDHRHGEIQSPAADDDSEAATEPATPADLIVFVNQASNALMARQTIGAFHKHHVEFKRNGQKQPLILSLTSKGDGATRYFLPIGQTASSWRRSLRKYETDKNGAIADPDSPPNITDQKRFFTTAPAFIDELQSHRVRVKNGKSCGPDGREAEVDMNDEGEAKFKTYCIERIQAGWNTTPYWVMQLPPSLVPDHNTIWTRRFTDFMASFLPPIEEMKAPGRPVNQLSVQ
jgi:hypothetical protein